jgi:hypothetical protein
MLHHRIFPFNLAIRVVFHDDVAFHAHLLYVVQNAKEVVHLERARLNGRLQSVFASASSKLDRIP